MVPGCNIRSLISTSQYYINVMIFSLICLVRKPVSNIHYESNKGPDQPVNFDRRSVKQAVLSLA